MIPAAVLTMTAAPDLTHDSGSMVEHGCPTIRLAA